MRQILLAAGNAAFVYLLIPNLPSGVFLAGFLLSGYAVAMFLRSRPGRIVFAAYLVALLTTFMVLQKYAFLDALLPAHVLEHPFNIVGLSYMLFRHIHFLVDSMQGQIKSPSLLAYLNYQLNLLTLLAGPIQRYQAFQEYWRHPEPILDDRYALLKTHLRILTGVIKIAAIAAVFLFVRDKLWSQLLDAHRAPQLWTRLGFVVKFALVFYVYPAYVYFNFAGYCDIVIGAGALLGQKLPENFVRPYLSRNVLDFWTRWHRTLGFWIRDYLFMPMYKFIAERKPRMAPSLAFVCYFVAFFFVGVWHGTTANFAVFGLLHGLGASGVKLWEMLLMRRFGRPGLLLYLESRLVRWLAIFATLHYVCFSMLFFSAQLTECMSVLRLLGTVLSPSGWAR